MGMIYVMSTPVSTFETEGIMRDEMYGSYSHIKRINVTLKDGASSDGLRFWIMHGDSRSYLSTYENGSWYSVASEHIVANQAKLLEIDSNGNVSNTIAFSSRGMTKDTLESIPESKLLECLQNALWVAVLISWEQSGSSSSAKFPVKNVEITGKRYKGMFEHYSPNDPSDDVSMFYTPSVKLLESKTYEFETARTIKYSDFDMEKDEIYYAPNASGDNVETKTRVYGRGAIVLACFKNSDGNWSQWRLVTESLEDQENVIAMKLRVWLAVTSETYTWGTGEAAVEYQGYTGPAWINSITFDRQSAEGTYVGGTFTTKTLHLANEARRVHATLVHKENLNVKAYVSLRAEGTLVSGESLGTGNGSRRSVTLQHTNGLTNDGFKLYFDGVEQEVSSYSLATSSGLVTYNAPSGVVVTCDYYYNAGVENFVEMNRIATYRNIDKPGMLESQFKYETENGGKVVTLKAEVEGDGKIEQFAVFFNE